MFYVLVYQFNMFYALPYVSRIFYIIIIFHLHEGSLVKLRISLYNLNRTLHVQYSTVQYSIV